MLRQTCWPASTFFRLQHAVLRPLVHWQSMVGRLRDLRYQTALAPLSVQSTGEVMPFPSNTILTAEQRILLRPCAARFSCGNASIRELSPFVDLCTAASCLGCACSYPRLHMVVTSPVSWLQYEEHGACLRSCTWQVHCTMLETEGVEHRGPALHEMPVNSISMATV